MADVVAVAPELPFRTQAVEFIQHLSRCGTNPNDAAAARELLGSFDSVLKVEEGTNEISAENRKAAIKSMVNKVVELKGALEGAKEMDAESSHLLLQHLLATNFDASSDDYINLSKQVVESVKKAGETAWNASKIQRHETVCRVLGNTYNFLPASSPLRPTVLLALLSLLALSSDLSALALTASSLSASLSQWSTSSEEKLAFLNTAASIYAAAGESQKALDLQLLLVQLGGGAETVEKALVYALADDKRFSLDSVLESQGVKEKVSGKASELVKLFESDPVEAVKSGQQWVGNSSNSSWLEGQGISQLNSESVLRKLRLVALVSAASKSSQQQLSYAEVASALSIEESDVEEWVVDAINEDLLKARLSQPTSTVRIISVTSVGVRSFGSSEWQLLEKRLSEWKSAISEVKSVVDEAEASAASGPITHRNGRPDGRQQGQGSSQPNGQREEIAA